MKISIISPLFFFSVLQGLFFPVSSSALEKIAVVSNVHGKVWLLRAKAAKEGKWLAVDQKGYPIYKGDKIRTKIGRAEITFLSDRGIVRLFEKTELAVSETGGPGKRFRKIRLFLGRLWTRIPSSRKVLTEFHAQTTLVEVIGTVIEFWMTPDGTVHVACTRGRVTVTARGVTTTLEAGQKVAVARGEAPGLPVAYTPTPEPKVEELVVAPGEKVVPAPGVVVVPASAPAPSAVGGGGGPASPAE